MRRIGVVKPDPLDTLDVGHLLYQLGNMLLAVDIYAIVRQLLGNDLQFLDTLTDQPAHLVQYLLHRPALVMPRNKRYRAVGTVAVAAFGNLYVGIVAGRRQVPMCGTTQKGRFLLCTPLHTGRGQGVGLQVLHQLLVVELAVPAIDLGNLRLQLCQVAFREASHDVQSLQAPLALGLCQFQNGIDALLLGVGNKSAGVHHGNVALRLLGIVCHTVAVSLEESHQHFAVNQVLRTP